MHSHEFILKQAEMDMTFIFKLVSTDVSCWCFKTNSGVVFCCKDVARLMHVVCVADRA